MFSKPRLLVKSLPTFFTWLIRSFIDVFFFNLLNICFISGCLDFAYLHLDLVVDTQCNIPHQSKFSKLYKQHLFGHISAIAKSGNYNRTQKVLSVLMEIM